MSGGSASPFWVIRLDFIHVLFASWAVGLLIVVFGSTIASAPASLLSRGPAVVAWALPALSAWSAVYLAVTLHWRTLSWISSFAVGELASLFVSLYLVYDLLVRPVRRFRNAGDWPTRWSVRVAQIAQRNDSIIVSTLRLGSKRYGAMPALGMASFIVGLIALASLGRFLASNTSEFMLSVRPPQCAAIRRYGEGLLCVDIDINARRLLGRFHVLPYVDSSRAYAMVLVPGVRQPVDTTGLRAIAEPSGQIKPEVDSVGGPRQDFAARRGWRL